MKKYRCMDCKKALTRKQANAEKCPAHCKKGSPCGPKMGHSLPFGSIWDKSWK